MFLFLSSLSLHLFIQNTLPCAYSRWSRTDLYQFPCQVCHLIINLCKLFTDSLTFVVLLDHEHLKILGALSPLRVGSHTRSLVSHIKGQRRLQGRLGSTRVQPGFIQTLTQDLGHLGGRREPPAFRESPVRALGIMEGRRFLPRPQQSLGPAQILSAAQQSLL